MRKYKAWSAETQMEAERMFHDGYNMGQISKALNHSRSCVVRHLASLVPYSDAGKNGLTTEEREYVKRAMDEGESMTNISKRIGRNIASVIRYVDSYTDGREARKRFTSKSDVDYVKEHFGDRSLRDISRELGINYFTLVRLAKSLNLHKANEIDIEEFKRDYPTMTTWELMAKYGVNKAKVYNTAHRLKLSKSYCSQTRCGEDRQKAKARSERLRNLMNGIV